MVKKGKNASRTRQIKALASRNAGHSKQNRELEAKKQKLQVCVNVLQSSSSIVDHKKLYQELHTLATSKGGFVSDEFRQALWPYLLGFCDEESKRSMEKNHYVQYTGSHRDDQQLEKDIDRSLWNYDIVKNIKETERKAKRRALTHIINAVLRKNEALHYFQGYHDICSVFLLVLDDRIAFHLLERASGYYYREPMRANFESVMSLTRLLFPLIQTQDQEVHQYLVDTGVEPFFALPWLITWFSHHVETFHVVARLFDVLLCSHPFFCLYLSAALALENRTRVLKCDCDFGSMHSLLSKLALSLEPDKVVQRATEMMANVSPAQLLALYADQDGASSTAATSLSSSMYMKYPFEYQHKFGISTLPSWESIQQSGRRKNGSQFLSLVTSKATALSVQAWLFLVTLLIILLLAIFLLQGTGNLPSIFEVDL